MASFRRPAPRGSIRNWRRSKWPFQLSRAELLGKLVPAPEATFLQSFVQSVDVLPLDEAAIQATIRLRQQHRVKLPDAIIAATALAHGLPLLTRNLSNFQTLAGLVVADLHTTGPLP